MKKYFNGYIYYSERSYIQNRVDPFYILQSTTDDIILSTLLFYAESSFIIFILSFIY